MKAILPLLLATALLHAEEPSPAAPAPAAPATVPPVPQVQEPAAGGASSPSEPTAHAEPAESGSPAGGAGERSKTDGVPHAEPAENAETKPHAESAESGSPAGGAGERSETEGVPHAEPAETKPHAEPAAPGGDAIQHSAFSTQHSPLSATVSLIDGSILQGALRPRFLPARSPTLGEFRIDLAKVARIAFLPTSGGNSAGLDRLDRLDRLGSQAAQVQQVQPVQPVHDCRVSFTNGDTLTATLAPRHDRFVLDTLLGRVRIPLRAVSSISFVPPHSAFSTQHTALLYHCTFDNPSAISSPSAGPAGRFLGGSFVPGKVGNALRTYADEPAAEVDFEPGTLGPRGTIEFWAKADDRDDSELGITGGNLRFFGVWHSEKKDEKPRWCTTHLQFTSNDGMGMSGLCGMVNHCSWASNPTFGRSPYDLIAGDRFGWHHYAIVWDVDGLPGTAAEDGGLSSVAIYLDGKPVPTRGRKTLSFGRHLNEIPALWGKLAFPTPSTGWNSSAGHIPFLIDEFRIWGAAKTEFPVRPDLTIPNRHLEW